MKKIEKNDPKKTTPKSTEDKNAKVEINKARKQIRTGITGGWRMQAE